MMPPGPWTPLKLSGCVLWIRSHVGTTVSAGNATAVVDHGPLAAHPTILGTLPVTASSIGSMPGFVFDGSTNGLFNSTQRILAKDSARTAIAVIRAEAGAVFPYGGYLFNTPYGTTNQPYFLDMWAYSSGFYVYGNAPGNAQNVAYGGSPTDAHIVEWLGSGTVVTVGVDGAYLTPTRTQSAETDAVGYQLGATPLYTNRAFAGRLAEFIVYNRALSAIEASSVRRFFANLNNGAYGITVTN